MLIAVNKAAGKLVDFLNAVYVSLHQIQIQTFGSFCSGWSKSNILSI